MIRNEVERRIIFKLDDVMKKKHINKNQLCLKTGLRFETIQGYYNGTVSRIDLYVISELCEYLNCSIDELIEYK